MRCFPSRSDRPTNAGFVLARTIGNGSRLLILRVPPEVAERRRANLEADAKRRAQPVRQRAWELADWTILLTDAPADLLSLQEALVLVRERWQMEMLYKLWKQYGRIDEWRTTNPWRGRMSSSTRS